MTRDRRRDPRFDRVRVASLQAYLLRRGWKRTPFPRHELLRFEEVVGAGTEPIVQFVPATEQLADFPLRVEDVLMTLSKLENRPVGDILDDIIRSNIDGIPLSLDTGETTLGMPETRANE